MSEKTKILEIIIKKDKKLDKTTITYWADDYILELMEDDVAYRHILSLPGTGKSS